MTTKLLGAACAAILVGVMVTPAAAQNEQFIPHLVYRTGETAWVRAARNAGHRAADGEGMLVEQGALSFERWFGIEPDRNAMWSALHN